MEQIKDKRIDILTTYLFCAIELALYVLVFTTSGILNKIVSFLCVVFAFLYSLKHLSKNKITILMQVGLFATVMADLFLVVIEPQFKSIAMVFFSITQICYFFRLISLSQNKKLHSILRTVYVLVVFIITVVVLKQKTDFLSLISMFYYANLILNVVYAFAYFKKSPLFAIGLLLFLFCDTLIGLDVAAGAYLNIAQGSIIDKLLSLPFNLAWVFYVPSQVLIALSVKDTKQEK